jgi:hypothetical protein
MAWLSTNSTKGRLYKPEKPHRNHQQVQNGLQGHAKPMPKQTARTQIGNGYLHGQCCQQTCTTPGTPPASPRPLRNKRFTCVTATKEFRGTSVKYSVSEAFGPYRVCVHTGEHRSGQMQHIHWKNTHNACTRLIRRGSRAIPKSTPAH